MVNYLPRLGYIAALVFLILTCQYGAETLGQLHYELDGHTHVYDIAHKYLPDLHDWQWIVHLILLVLLVFAFFQTDGYMILRSTFFMLLVVLVIRALTVVSTVLPKHADCVVEGSGFWNFLQGGGCYDKIFSGHVAFVTLITLNLLKYGDLSLPVFWLITLVNAILMLLTRGHYTVDVILGFVIPFLVFDAGGAAIKKVIPWVPTLLRRVR